MEHGYLRPVELEGSDEDRRHIILGAAIPACEVGTLSGAERGDWNSAT